ncbi:MAG: ABC transporter substrate-binding protein [Saccharofermentanales bacterium]
MKKISASIISFVMAATLFTGCNLFGGRLTDVRIAIQGNVGGAPLAGIAQEQGFFEEEGIRADITVVEDGPSGVASMRADQRTIDCGFIDAGTAWNAIDPSGNGLKFIFLDNLSNSEALIARKGQFTDANGNGFYDYREIYEGLQGKTVYMDTSASPGGWFKDLLAKTHTILKTPDDKKLWISTGIAGYLTGYEAPNSSEEFKVTVVQISNADLQAAMDKTGAGRADIAVGYAPVPETIIASDRGILNIASTDTHLSDQYFPSTWVASVKWMEESPETVQKVVNALFKALAYRAASDANQKEALAAGERIAQKAAGSFDASAAVWPTKEEYKEWFANTEGMGYTYMKSLYEAKKASIPEGAAAKSFADCFADAYILKAIKESS